MQRIRPVLSSLVAAGLLGCTSRPVSLQAPLPALSAPATAPAAAGPAAEEYGSLSLEIRWPDRPAYGAQVIPTSTNALILTLRGPGVTFGTPGPVLLQETIARQPGAALVSKTYKLKAANNLSLEVLAYQESAPDYATSKPIARGTGNVNIVRSVDSAASITLASLYAPTITALSTNFGKPGDVVTVTGDNFGAPDTPLPVVSFNSATASVTRASSSSLSVTVPQSASTGRLVVQVDGVSSTSYTGFWIPGALSISAPKAAWDTGTPSTSRAVLLGQTLQFAATPTWVNGPFGTFYVGQPPQPTWQSSNPAAGTVDSTGKFTAGDQFATTTLAAKLDNGQSSVTSNQLEAVAEDLRVVLAAPSGTLGAKGQDTLRLSAYNLLSDGATNSLVTYAASAGVTVTADGVASGSTTVDGPIQVSATSQLITSRVATAAVQVANFVVSTLAGHLSNGGNFGSLDGDALTYATFGHPFGIAVNPANGTTFVMQISGGLRRIAGRTVTTLALNGLPSIQPQAMAYDPIGKTLYVPDNYYQRIYRITLDAAESAVATWSILAGNPTTATTGHYLNGTGTAAQFDNPQAVAYDSSRGVLYVADRNNDVIRRIDSTGNVSLFAGTPVTSGSADGGPNVATFAAPCALTLDADGNLYVLDAGKLRKVAPDGTVVTLATSRPIYGSSVYQNTGYSGTGLVRDAAGNLYVCEDYQSNVIDRIAPDGTVTRIAGNGVPTYDPYGSPAQSLANGVGTKAAFSGPTCLAIDATGSLYVTDFWNNAIRLLR